MDVHLPGIFVLVAWACQVAPCAWFTTKIQGNGKNPIALETAPAEALVMKSFRLKP